MEDFLNSEEEDWGWGEENELVTQYENMLKNHHAVFFSVDDYEQLYFHYIHFYADACYLTQEQLAKSGAVLNAAIAQYPDAETLQLLQAYHFYKENRITKIMLIDKMERLPPPNYEQEHYMHVMAHIYRQVEERHKALSLLTSMLKKAVYQEDKTALYYDIMFLYETAENAQKAIECCKNILKAGTINHEVLFGEMYEYFFLKPIAVPAFELLTQEYTFSTYAWLYLGKSYADIMMFEESAQALNYAVAISNHPLPLICLGRILTIAGDLQQAFDCFEEAFQMDTSQTGLYTEMGEILYNMEDSERAIHFFSQAIDADKNDINALLGMALALASLERYNDSIAYIMQAKKVDELSLDAWLLLADDYIEVNRDGEALEIYQQLAKQYPKDTDIWLSYSNYYAMMEDFLQASVIARQGLAVLQGNPLLLYRIANYCFLDRDIALGINYLQQAIQANSRYVNFFIDYDEEVLKIPEVVDIISEYKGENYIETRQN